MESIPLWPTPRPGDFQPYLTPFPLEDGAVHPAVIVCPGGAYCSRAPHEGDPISKKFNSLGFHAFTLEYRVHPQAHYPEPQLDALRAIRLVRSRSAEFRIDPEKILILGFSAGGHLASSTLYLYHQLEEASRAGDAADAFTPRPDGAILCYAVISSVNYMHFGSFQNLLGKISPSVEELLFLSGERNVHAEMPPAFLWHTAEDQAVPVENALHFAEAMRHARIPCGLKVYPFGAHGLGLAEQTRDARHWPEEAAEFFHTLWERADRQ